MAENDELQVQQALSVLPELRELVTASLELPDMFGDGLTVRGQIRTDPAARLDQMVISYLAAQHEHMRSVIQLESAGQHRDAWLIARTMIEGYAQLTWALTDDSGVRVEEWFWFSAVEDWRQLKVNEAKGRQVTPQEWQLADALLGQYGETYFTKNAKDARDAGQPLPADPYRSQWHRCQIRQMFEAIGSLRLYQSVYDSASEWAHWNPRALFHSLGPQAPFSTSTDDPRRAAQALLSGLAAYLETVRLVVRQFGSGDEQLVELAWERIKATMEQLGSGDATLIDPLST